MRLEVNFWRYAFFLIHFVGGFVVLFLSYYYIQMLLGEQLLNNVLLKSFVEVSYLVTGVVWGNAGWDRFGKFTSKCSLSELTQALVTTTTPVTIIFPPIVVISELLIRSSEHGWEWAWYQTSLMMVWLSFASLALIYIYRKLVVYRDKGITRAEAANAESR